MRPAWRRRTVAAMQRSSAMRLLAPAHAQILELADQGLETPDLAQQLGIDPSAVGPLLRIARSKLAALQALEDAADAATG